MQAFGASLPIHAHPRTREQIEGVAGSGWRSLMERWTNGATMGTKVVPPNRSAGHGDVLRERCADGSMPTQVKTPTSHGSCGCSVTTMRAAPMSSSAVRPMLKRWPV